MKGEAPIQLHPENGHYFLFRGRPTILITSAEHYGAVLNAEFDYIKYLDELQRHGLNQTRAWSGTYREIGTSFGIRDNTLAPRRYLAPWARSGDGTKYDLNQWDLAYFERLRDFLTQAGGRGVVVEYGLFCCFYSDELWAASPMNPINNVNGLSDCSRTEVFTLGRTDMLAVQENFVRKVVRELRDFDNVYFEICNEPYITNICNRWQAHVAEVIADVEKDMPVKHLIAQNIANGTGKIEHPHPAVSIFNFHYAKPPEAVAQNYALNRVIADDETGFAGKADVTYRREAWEFILAGGGVYSNLDYSFTTAHPAGDLAGYEAPGGGSPALRRQLQILRDFIESFDFIHMKPGNEIVKGGLVTAPLVGVPAQAGVTVRALSGDGHALYISGGERVELRLELPSGDYEVQWIDTCTGATDKVDRFNHQGGALTLASPAYSEDIALRILPRGRKFRR